MRTVLPLSLVAAMLAVPAAAAPAPQHAAVSLYGDPGTPDLAGLWLGQTFGIPGKGPQSNSGTTADGGPFAFFTPSPLPYTPEYQKISDERVAAAKAGHALGDTGARCLPFGITQMMTSIFYPDEIVQTPGRVTIFVFGTFPIVIWTDGRSHPAGLQPSYNGHSIGHWVGDTLHVDTVGIVGGSPLDSARDPHSDALHMQWTIRRSAPDMLTINLTFDDPKAFTKPVSMTQSWHRKSGPKWQLLDDQSCFENNQTVAPPPAAEGFIKF